jgi:hypothetical protein
MLWTIMMTAPFVRLSKLSVTQALSLDNNNSGSSNE